MLNKTLPEDIGVNNLVNGKVLNYHKDKQPTPPSEFFTRHRHWWIAKFDVDEKITSPKRLTSLCILEWNPVKRMWYASGSLAVIDSPYMCLQGYIIISRVGIPDIPLDATI